MTLSSIRRIGKLGGILLRPQSSKLLWRFITITRLASISRSDAAAINLTVTSETILGRLSNLPERVPSKRSVS